MTNPIFKVCIHRHHDGNEAIVAIEDANAYLRAELVSRMKETMAAMEVHLNEELERRLSAKLTAAIDAAAEQIEAYLKEQLTDRLAKTSGLKHMIFTDYFEKEIEKVVPEALEGAVAQALDLTVRV